MTDSSQPKYFEKRFGIKVLISQTISQTFCCWSWSVLSCHGYPQPSSFVRKKKISSHLFIVIITSLDGWKLNNASFNHFTSNLSIPNTTIRQIIYFKIICLLSFNWKSFFFLYLFLKMLIFLLFPCGLKFILEKNNWIKIVFIWVGW